MTDAATPAEGNLPAGFDWAIIEIFGHRRLAGRIIEEERFGAKMLRIDLPSVEFTTPTPEQPDAQRVITGWVTQWYGGASLFSITIADEANVLKARAPYAPHRYTAITDASDGQQLDGDEDESPF